MTDLPSPAAPVPDELYARLARALAPAYEMEGEIGRGGMAVVYRARDTRLKRGVAVKLLPPDLTFRADIRSRFLREAETSARLAHPHIVPIYTVDERDGLVYFVMALVLGGSVGDRLRRIGALPVDECRRILREVASALDYAHKNGVVHRDIKPDNVLLDLDSGRAMVTDFGIARAASEEGDGSRLTATGAAIGTPAYMSPEQCAGDRDLDGRSDLYSLGAVAYHMLTGEPPFTGSNTPSVMMKQVTERPVPVRQRRSDVPEDLERIVMKLLEKDPAQRFPDGESVVAAVDGAPVAPLSYAPAVPPPSEEPEALRGVYLSLPAMSINLAGGGSRHAAREIRRAARRRRGKNDRDDPSQPLASRIRGFRRHFASWIGTSGFLMAINALTNRPGHHFWWAGFAVFGIGIGVVTRGGALWADGVRLRDLFSGTPPIDLGNPDGSATLSSSAAAPGLPAPALALAPPDARVSNELLDGPHGAVLRQGVADRRTALDLISRLTDTERKMLPDVTGSAEALYERIVALAGALHRLEDQAADDRLPALDERIARIEREPDDAADHERRLNLLKRQRDMVADLVQSRARLLEQYESAGILLQNLTLDLLKIRSSGLDSAMSGLASATQEARALSREIGYVLDAAKDLEKL